MKILVICQYYYPEPFRVNAICEEMVKRGHEVTVVTGEPNYPEGEIYQGYENHQRPEEVINGVTVHRCPIIPRRTGTFYRFLNYFSYPHEAKKYTKDLMASADKPFDVVLVNQLSPVMMAEPAIKYKRKYGTPIVLYCLDLWPESLVAGGISRGSFIYNFFHKVSKKIYCSANYILVTSRTFKSYFEKEFNIDSRKIEYLPQYAEELFETIPQKEPDEIANLMFAGNIGNVQSVETILGAAELLEGQPVHFHIVGGGTDLERLKKIAKERNIVNVTFYGRRLLEDMPMFYSKADAMLVSLKADPVLSLTLPGKVQSYMAAGKPIIGSINGETASVITNANCGYCGKAEDSVELANKIKQFVKLDANEKMKMGENSRKYYEEHFTIERFMDCMERSLLQVLG